ncbi:MAG: molybdopterin-guanine dinucleotide biosynthesis protein B [Comamonas sp.]
MHVVCFAGYSGSGKTTLIERLIPLLCQRGLRVSVIKHTHHRFDVDTPGKDTWRHREAGALEVLAASDMRTVLMRENTQPREPDVHQLIAQLDASADWVLVEGFKHSDLPKLEIRRSAALSEDRPALYPHDACVQAVVTDLALATRLPLLPVDDPQAVLHWLLARADAFAYTPPCVFAGDVA